MLRAFAFALVCGGCGGAAHSPASPSRDGQWEKYHNGNDEERHKLPEKKLGRIEAAYAYLKPAFESWALKDFGRDCVLVFEEEQEWLVGCPEMNGKAGFTFVQQRPNGLPIFHNPKSLALSGSYSPYKQVMLSTVGTVGSLRNDSTNTDSPVLILQDWDALHRNHPAFAQSSIEEWLGVFVHEAFHAHQMWHPNVRALILKMREQDRTVPATADELAAFYKSNEAYRDAIRKEFDLLRDAANDSTSDPKIALKALGTWQSLYAAREKTFHAALEDALPGKSAQSMDWFLTFLEGTARYVEAQFLIAPSEEFAALLKTEPTFKNFSDSKGKRFSDLPGLGNLGSKYFYTLGMYLCVLLDRVDTTWKSSVFSAQRLLLGEVDRVVRKDAFASSTQQKIDETRKRGAK